METVFFLLLFIVGYNFIKGRINWERLMNVEFGTQTGKIFKNVSDRRNAATRKTNCSKLRQQHRPYMFVVYEFFEQIANNTVDPK